MARKGKPVESVAYMRTSTGTNVGEGKDREKRQRAAIEAYAKSAGYTITSDDWFYDAAVKGTDPVTARPGFGAVLDRIASDGVRTIIVESPDRFAQDLAMQLAGHDYLKNLGVALVPASAPDFFLEDTPTAVLVRQVLGAIAQFEKATIVAKLKAARDRKRERAGKCEGRSRIACAMRCRHRVGSIRSPDAVRPPSGGNTGFGECRRRQTSDRQGGAYRAEHRLNPKISPNRQLFMVPLSSCESIGG
jgi:DNA invertase Pin-like site-specific DNA recombinase